MTLQCPIPNFCTFLIPSFWFIDAWVRDKQSLGTRQAQLTMSQWLCSIRECREPGKEGRVWELTKKGLSVGRSSDCDVQLLSQSVEERHAVFEWLHKKEVFVVRDLGSINGTYLNSKLLRNTFGEVEHGSSVRFGYERGHMFRVEMAKSPAPATPTSSNVASTQTSPVETDRQQTGQAAAVQYVPIPSQPPTYVIPAMQPVSYIMQQPVAYGYPPVTTCIVTPVHQYMQHPITSPANFPMSPAQIATPPPTMPTTSEHILEESPVRPRKDGRRSISLSEAPNLSKGTPLYGNPAWWGEEDPTSDAESPSSSPGGRILRDLEPDRPRTAAREELNRTWKGSAGHELRKKAFSNRAQERGSDSPTSWVIKLDSAPSQRPSRRLDKERRPRSADPSPIRCRSGVSPNRRSVSPCPSPRQSPVPQRKSTTVSKKTKVLTSTRSRKPPAKKPPSGATPPSKPRPEQKTELVSHSESPVSAQVEPISWNESHSGSSQGSPLSHRPRKCPSDTHMSFKADTTYIISEMDRPGSARKQWTNVQPQAPDSLMLASIEARMRRLSKMAQSTAQSVSSLKQTLMAAHYVVAPSSPLPAPTEQDLPEWKFFNKEVDSIFRNIRSVEKWLKEIDSTSVSLQGNVTCEEVDYEKEYSSTESEVFPDSMEDVCYSSETEEP